MDPKRPLVNPITAFSFVPIDGYIGAPHIGLNNLNDFWFPYGNKATTIDDMIQKYIEADEWPDTSEGDFAKSTGIDSIYRISTDLYADFE